MTDLQDPDEAVGTIKRLKRQVLKSKENLNDIIELKEYTKKPNDDSVRFAAMKALEAIFTRFLDRKDFTPVDSEPQAKKQKTDQEALAQVREWLSSQFEATLSTICDMVDDPEPGIQIPALKALLSFEHSIGSSLDSPYFYGAVFPRAITRLVTGRHFNEHVLDVLREEYVHMYHDVSYHLLLTLRNVISEFLLETTESNETTCENVFLLLRTVKPVPLDQAKRPLFNYFVKIQKDWEGSSNSAKKPDGAQVGTKRKRDAGKKPAMDRKKNPYALSLEKFKRSFQDCWTSYLGVPGLPDHVFTMILRTIHVDLIPNFSEPILLMDLLSDTYDKAEELMKSGSVSLHGKERAKEEEKSILALNGLFYLIVNHNLTYSSFFPKLYRMMTVSLLHDDNADQFFSLLCTFLKTPLIPDYMIFAFVKRLARLALLAPSPLHDQDKGKSAQGPLHLSKDSLLSDPFLFWEMDMKLCKADESSLWELHALGVHFVPSLRALGKKFNNNFSAKSMFLLSEEIASAKYTALFEKEMKRKVKNGIPLSFQEPAELISPELYPGWE